MTVEELIAELRKYPADAPVYIEDTDTQWDLPVHVRLDGALSRARHGVRIFGQYGEALGDE